MRAGSNLVEVVKQTSSFTDPKTSAQIPDSPANPNAFLFDDTPRDGN